MNKEIIEKYIKFAFDNGFKDLDGYKFLGLKYEIDHILGEFETNNGMYSLQLLGDSILEIITSRAFIKAVASGVINEYGFCTHDTYNLTIKQALAIRDNKLEEFILSIIK